MLTTRPARPTRLGRYGASNERSFDARQSYGALSLEVIQALVNNPSSVIENVVIQSRFTPDIVIDTPFVTKDPSSADSKGEAIAAKLQPKVTMNVKGYGPITLAPYGEPGPTAWPWITAGLWITGGVLVYTAVTVLQTFFKKGGTK